MPVVVEEGLHPNGMDLVVSDKPTEMELVGSPGTRRLYADKFRCQLKFGDIEALLIARVIFDHGKIRFVRSLNLYDLETEQVIPKTDTGSIYLDDQELGGG